MFSTQFESEIKGQLAKFDSSFNWRPNRDLIRRKSC